MVDDNWVERLFWRWDGRRQARFYRRWKRALRRHEERYRDMHPAPILCMDSRAWPPVIRLSRGTGQAQILAQDIRLC